MGLTLELFHKQRVVGRQDVSSWEELKHFVAIFAGPRCLLVALDVLDQEILARAEIVSARENMWRHSKRKPILLVLRAADTGKVTVM